MRTPVVVLLLLLAGCVGPDHAAKAPADEGHGAGAADDAATGGQAGSPAVAECSPSLAFAQDQYVITAGEPVVLEATFRNGCDERIISEPYYHMTKEGLAIHVQAGPFGVDRFEDGMGIPGRPFLQPLVRENTWVANETYTWRATWNGTVGLRDLADLDGDRPERRPWAVVGTWHATMQVGDLHATAQVEVRAANVPLLPQGCAYREPQNETLRTRVPGQATLGASTELVMEYAFEVGSCSVLHAPFWRVRADAGQAFYRNPFWCAFGDPDTFLVGTAGPHEGVIRWDWDGSTCDGATLPPGEHLLWAVFGDAMQEDRMTWHG